MNNVLVNSSLEMELLTTSWDKNIVKMYFWYRRISISDKIFQSFSNLYQRKPTFNVEINLIFLPLPALFAKNVLKSQRCEDFNLFLYSVVKKELEVTVSLLNLQLQLRNELYQ